MTIEQFKQLESSGDDFLLVDVREKEEVEASGAYRGAQNIPMGKMFTEAAKDNLSKDSKIVVYCASGARAGIVAKELQSRGFDIEPLDSGYAELAD